MHPSPFLRAHLEEAKAPGRGIYYWFTWPGGLHLVESVNYQNTQAFIL